MKKVLFSQKPKPILTYLITCIDHFWFIPSDALLRAIEANIWHFVRLKHPVLDIGVGDGQMSKIIFANLEILDVGIDIDPSGLEDANKTKKYKKIIRADAASLPFKDNSFATVVSNSTFEHVRRDKKAVSEVSRVLKTGGLFYITVPSYNLRQYIEELSGKDALAKFNLRAKHFHYRKLAEWKNIFKHNNLRIIYHSYYFPKSIALYWYKLFSFFTKQFNGKEFWSWIGHSKLSYLFPKKTIQIMEKNWLIDKFFQGFLIKKDEGGELFMVAEKVTNSE